MTDRELLQEKVDLALLRFQGRQLFNTVRALMLTKTARELSKSRIATDMLRAAVVLLHASVEDCLRTVAAEILPTLDGDFLNTIPLLGSESRRPEKFFLGNLAQHRKRTVEDLIAESVKSYLETVTFNDMHEVRKVLTVCKLDIEPVEKLLPQIQEMMKRRHQIVHRADFQELAFTVHTLPEPLSVESVEKWANASQDFIIGVGRQVTAKHLHDAFLTAKVSMPEAQQIMTSSAAKLKEYVFKQLG